MSDGSGAGLSVGGGVDGGWRRRKVKRKSEVEVKKEYGKMDQRVKEKKKLKG